MSQQLWHEFGVTLERTNADVAWGIRLAGGSDLNSPLIIIRVITLHARVSMICFCGCKAKHKGCKVNLIAFINNAQPNLHLLMMLLMQCPIGRISFHRALETRERTTTIIIIIISKQQQHEQQQKIIADCEKAK